LADAEACDGEDNDNVTCAADWLSNLVANGPVDQPTIKAKAREAGHAWATVRRARQRIGIKASKLGMKGGWVWELPQRCSKDAEDAHSKMVSTFGEFEHLRAEGKPDEVEGVL
jgi:hypothetical protein